MMRELGEFLGSFWILAGLVRRSSAKSYVLSRQSRSMAARILTMAQVRAELSNRAKLSGARNQVFGPVDQRRAVPVSRVLVLVLSQKTVLPKEAVAVHDTG